MSRFLLEHVLKGEFGEFWILSPTHLSCYWNHILFFPRGKDRLLSKENSENMQDTFSAPHPRVILPDEHLKLNPSGQPLSFPTSTDPEALPRRSTGVLSMHNPATKDLLSGLCVSILYISLQTSPDDICVPVWRWDGLKGGTDCTPSCCITPRRPSWTATVAWAGLK